jgi:hypothetical protein
MPFQAYNCGQHKDFFTRQPDVADSQMSFQRLFLELENTTTTAHFFHHKQQQNIFVLQYLAINDA